MNIDNLAFDYKTLRELISHLREHADRTAGGGPDDKTYDPETFCLEHDAANVLEMFSRMFPDDTDIPSPNFTPQELKEFRDRGFERKNRSPS